MGDSSQPVIVDTSSLVSLMIELDSNHKEAVDLLEQYKSETANILIPNDVLVEFVNLLGKKFGHEIANKSAEKLVNSASFFIVESSEQLRGQALQLFSKQPAAVSLTDCVVMALAEMSSTKRVFGFDEVFKKNGYRI